MYTRYQEAHYAIDRHDGRGGCRRAGGVDVNGRLAHRRATSKRSPGEADSVGLGTGDQALAR